MSIASLKQRIEEMKSALSQLKLDLELKEQELENEQNKHYHLRIKVKDIIKMQSKEASLCFEIGGKEYRLSKRLIYDCKYSNKLRELSESQKQGQNRNDVIKIGRNKQYFQVILKIMLMSTNFDSPPRVNRDLRIFNDELTVKGMLSELNYYFLERNLENILQQVRLKINNQVVYKEGLNKILLLSKFTFPPASISNYLIRDISDINKPDRLFYLMKGTDLTLEFIQPISITKIHLKAFRTSFDSKNKTNEGANEVIYSYYYENDLRHLGFIPNTYGENRNERHTVHCTPIVLKGVIFMARDHNLSIGEIGFY